MIEHLPGSVECNGWKVEARAKGPLTAFGRKGSCRNGPAGPTRVPGAAPESAVEAIYFPHRERSMFIHLVLLHALNQD